MVAGALRYQFLKVKIGSDVVFDINDAVSLTGNTGSYLQYAHARARGILTKSEQAVTFPTELRMGGPPSGAGTTGRGPRPAAKK